MIKKLLRLDVFNILQTLEGIPKSLICPGIMLSGIILLITLKCCVSGDDPERCYGEGGGRGVHVWERM